MGERVIFSLPETNEEALWALPVAMEYLLVRKMSEEDRDAVDKVTVVSSLVELHPFIKACWYQADVVEDLSIETLNEADLIVEFNTRRAYAITEKVEKHISESYGILLGAVPAYRLPAIAQSNFDEKLGAVLVTGRNKNDKKREKSWVHREEFIRTGIEAGLAVSNLSDDVTFSEVVEAVSVASVVVGELGTGTLVGACLGKITFEMVQEGEEHKNWMEKSDCQKWEQLYGNLKDMTASFVWDRTQNLVKRCVEEKRKWASHQSPTLDPQAVGAGG